MTQAAPFLKMYSLYVQNFDEAINLVKTLSEKSNNFNSIIKQIQAMPECGSLSLQVCKNNNFTILLLGVTTSGKINEYILYLRKKWQASCIPCVYFFTNKCVNVTDFFPY